MRAFKLSERFTFVPLHDEEGDFGLLFDSDENTVTEIHTQNDLRSIMAQI